MQQVFLVVKPEDSEEPAAAVLELVHETPMLVVELSPATHVGRQPDTQYRKGGSCSVPHNATRLFIIRR